MPKPRSILVDMPWNVKKMIVESTDTLTKISLRPTAKSLKNVVDNSAIHYHEIILKSHKYSNIVTLDVNFTPQRTFVDFQLDLGYYRYLVFCIPGKFVKELKRADGLEFFAQKFTEVFRNPHAIVGTLEIKEFPTLRDANLMDRKERILSTIGTHLSRLPHKINVECLKISAQDQQDLVHFLPYIKPGVLKTIHLRPYDKEISGNFPLNTVTRMEQWKKARFLHIHSSNLMLPEEGTENFDDIYCDLDNLSLEQTKTSIETILNGATKLTCQAYRFDYDAIVSYLDHFENLQTPECKEFKIRRRTVSCNVKLFGAYYMKLVVFYNPEKTSVGDYFDVLMNAYKNYK